MDPLREINKINLKLRVSLIIKCYILFFRFEIRLRVILTEEGHLILRSRVKNINGKPFGFSFAFRTYFAISDIR